MFTSNRVVNGFPVSGRSITDFGIPEDIKKIDAAFIWSFNKRTYLISGDMYWKLNMDNDQVEYDYPRDMDIWRNVPVPVDAAFQYISGTWLTLLYCNLLLSFFLGGGVGVRLIVSLHT